MARQIITISDKLNNQFIAWSKHYGRSFSAQMEVVLQGWINEQEANVPFGEWPQEGEQ